MVRTEILSGLFIAGAAAFNLVNETSTPSLLVSSGAPNASQTNYGPDVMSSSAPGNLSISSAPVVPLMTSGFHNGTGFNTSSTGHAASSTHKGKGSKSLGGAKHTTKSGSGSGSSSESGSRSSSDSGSSSKSSKGAAGALELGDSSKGIFIGLSAAALALLI